jgi:transposase InsO family protein
MNGQKDAFRASVHRHVHSPFSNFDKPIKRFDHVHVDLVGPLPASNGYTHLLTVVDRVTRWPVAIPLNCKASTIDIAVAFLGGWIQHFGLPSDISSDSGSHYTSALWSDLSMLLGTKLHHTTAYHPQTNGLVERFHRRMKDSLRAKCNTPSWSVELSWIMLGIRTTVKEDLGTTSAEFVYNSRFPASL